MKSVITVLLSFVFTKAFSQSIIISPNKNTFYSERNVDILITGPANKKASYKFIYANRILAKGSIIFDGNGKKTVQLFFPKLKQGVSAEALLKCSYLSSTEEKKLNFFPFEAFASSAPIYLFDINGSVKEALKKHGAVIKALKSLNKIESEIGIINGLNFTEFPQIQDVLKKLCEQGKKLIFVNSIGSFKIPENTSSIKFQDSDFAKQIDKRFYLGELRRFIHFKDKNKLDFQRNATQGFTYCRIKVDKGEIIIISELTENMFKENPSSVYLIKNLLNME